MITCWLSLKKIEGARENEKYVSDISWKSEGTG